VSLLVLLILAVVWGVFLVPQVLRARADRGPADSIGSFRNQLSMIERSLPSGSTSRHVRRGDMVGGYPQLAAVGAPLRSMPSSPSPSYGAPLAGSSMASVGLPTRSELQRRRQNVLLALLGAVVLTLALGLVFPPAFALNAVADLALAGYVVLLVRVRTIAAEREMKVRYLPAAAAGPGASAEPALRSIAR
jgi:hypothetical protein